MHLFKTSRPVKKTELNLLTFATLLGEIDFDLKINETKIKSFRPLETVSFQNSAISCWIIENAQVEFLQTHFKPKLSPSMEVKGCLAGIWRVKSFKDSSISFRTVLNSNPLLQLESFSESGEGLISIAFESDEIQLSIGTEDEDYLDSRAQQKKWMPQYFSKEIFESSLEFISDGIEINLPLLKEEEDFIQIQFVAAWSLKRKDHETSCWFAVEQSPEYILKESGII